MALLDENGFGLTGSFLFTAAQILLVVLLSELHFFSPLGAGGTGQRPGECGRRIAGRDACPTQKVGIPSSGRLCNAVNRVLPTIGPQRAHTAPEPFCGSFPASPRKSGHRVAHGPTRRSHGNRVNRDDVSGPSVTGTIGTSELDQPLPVAPPHHRRDTNFT